MSKTRTPPPQPAPKPPGARAMSSHGATLLDRDLVWPGVPHTNELIIVRSPGGFLLFDGSEVDGMDELAPNKAIAVAPNTATLEKHVYDWATARKPE